MDEERARILRMKKLGILLRDARTAAGRSRKEVATALGISTSQLAAYENGTKAPSLPELEALAFYLRLPLEHFWSSETLANKTKEDKTPDLARLISLRQRIIGLMLRQYREAIGLHLAETARQTGIPVKRLRAYEMGKRQIPLPDLESLARVLNVPLHTFMDTEGPIGQWLIQQRQVADFLQLPDDLRAFVAKPVNRPYLELAQRLSEMSVEKLRAVAEGLLEITL